MWDMCQMLNIWHISHTKHKKQLPSNVAYVPKLYHLCPYRCKFAMVWTDVVKRNNVLYLAFSLLSLMVLISSLSLLTSNPASLNRERTKWHSNRIRGEADHLYRQGHFDWIIAIVIVVGGASSTAEATLIGSSQSSSSSEAQAAWVRPLRSSPSSSPLQSRRSLSLSRFWWLVVLIIGGWLILVDGGRLIGLWMWDLGWYWCLS